MAQAIYLLDTDTVSFIIRGQPEGVRERLSSVPMASVTISAITQAELLHGLAKKPSAKRLHLAVREFLIRVTTLPWDSAAAEAYAHLRAKNEKLGISLSNMDMLIAAHAMASDAILVTNDRAFYQFSDLIKLEDWTTPA